MSKEYPCVYWDGGKCKKFSDETVTSWCVEAPCKDQLMSNGDRVRSMSDEELAEWNNFCPYPTDECTLKGCTKCILEWLKKPATKEET